MLLCRVSGSRDERDRLRELLRRDALVRRDVSLRSGSASGFYFDCKRVTLTSEGAGLTARAFIREIERWPEAVRAVGGMAHGAISIVGSVVVLSGLSGFYVRDEPKKHGLMHLIENQPEAGTNVLILDDVVTSGGSLLRAVQAAREAGCSVVGAMALVDRGTGGGQRILQETGRYVPLFTKDEFPTGG